jgi:hypothetical protein
MQLITNEELVQTFHYARSYPQIARKKLTEYIHSSHSVVPPKTPQIPYISSFITTPSYPSPTAQRYSLPNYSAPYY